MTAKLIGAMILVLVSFGFAQPSPFSARVGLIDLFPTAMVEARILVQQIGVMARVGYVFPVLGLGEAYIYFAPQEQDSWTFMLAGGWLGLLPPNGFPFVGGGFEYSGPIAENGTRSNVEVGLVVAWYPPQFDPRSQEWRTILIPTLRFNLIFPL